MVSVGKKIPVGVKRVNSKGSAKKEWSKSPIWMPGPKKVFGLYFITIVFGSPK